MSKSVETHFPIRFTPEGSVMVCPVCGDEKVSVAGIAHYSDLSRLSFAGRCGHTFEAWFKMENGSTHLHAAGASENGEEIVVE